MFANVKSADVFAVNLEDGNNNRFWDFAFELSFCFPMLFNALSEGLGSDRSIPIVKAPNVFIRVKGVDLFEGSECLKVVPQRSNCSFKVGPD